MFKTRKFARNVMMAGALPLLAASSAFAQYGTYYPGEGQRVQNGYANRLVEGTIAAVAPARNGERIRLTNGMDLFVPNSIQPMNGGRAYQWSILQPGDTVRMAVYSRPGDGRDARVQSFEILQSRGIGRGGWDGRGDNRGQWNNVRQVNGTVVSFDRRNNLMVVQSDNGRMVNVDLNQYNGQYNNGQYNNNRGNGRNMRFRRGDRVTLSGQMDRSTGTFRADSVRTY